ncbi:MAG: hypothetical protein HFH66_16405 [Lachnospiraceae bacterium]|uniref:hypothetical protein n=1 Tax=uncultured Clostridium sp. TaxID=59620 RepID=UPI00272C9EAC|nr:hypothetical protein [uncultured Clostridium sp.]MCI8752895.1 hypothetical protein [Lachnospiraceae bacterium]
MNKGLFYSLLLNENDQESYLEWKEKSKKIYKEYEEAVKKFLEDGADTNKITEMEAEIDKYCNNYVDLLDMDELVKFILDILKNNDKCMQREERINLIIEKTVFLSKIGTLHSMFIKKQEEIRKNQEYRKSIEKIHGLKKLLKGITEDNNSFDSLCKSFNMNEEKMNGILNHRAYFNVRIIGQQRFVSLAPEGRKIQKYIKCTEEKRYTQDELENYIYMNSHRLINMFRQPNGYLPRRVTVIPLSDVRQNALSFEFKYVYNEIKQQNFEQIFHIDDIKSSFNSNSKFYDETRRKGNAEQRIPKLREFSEELAKNFASLRL